MKIEELYAKAIADENLWNAYIESAKEGKLSEFLATNGCTASKEEIKTFLAGKTELSDDELELVSGGGCLNAGGMLEQMRQDMIDKGVVRTYKGTLTGSQETTEETTTSTNELMVTPPWRML